MQDLWIIGVMLKVIGGLFAFAASIFTFVCLLQNEKHEKTKEWFRIRWDKLSKSPWLKMPEMIIGIVVNAEKALTRWMYADVDEFYSISLFFITPFALFIIGVIYYFNTYTLILCIILSIPIVTRIFHDTFKLRNFITYAIINFIKNFEELSCFIILVPIISGAVFCIYFALDNNLLYSVLATFLSIPCFFLIMFAPIVILEDLPNSSLTIRNESFYVLIGLSIGFSFFVTLLSFLIGNIISSGSYVPQTFQMLLSNVTFDGITLAFTITILRWSIKKNVWIRIPLAILYDIIIAAILACMSLYIGLLASDHHLSMIEVFHVLIGRAPAGGRIELGPLFWAMHTTFIPTCLYLFFIATGYVGKIITTIVTWFLGKGHENKNPLALTAGLCTVLATFFALSGIATDGLTEQLEKDQAQAKVVVTQQK